MHDSVTTTARPMGSANPLVDLMGHKDLGGKTMLYLVDGLYTTPQQNDVPARWQSPPFANLWPASLFVSQDPVAIESVCLDFFAAEKSADRVVGAADNYLHEAALAQKPPSGVRYDPAGSGNAAGLSRRSRALEQRREEAILAEPEDGRRDRVGDGVTG